MLFESPKELKAWKREIFWKWYIVAGPATFIVSAMAGSLPVFLGAMVVTWFATKFISGMTAEERMGRAMSRQETILNKLLGNPTSPKYFCIDYASVPCGIAVNTETVTAVCWTAPTDRLNNPTADDFVVHCVFKAELMEWSAAKPSAETLEAVGSVSTSAMLAMHRKNSAALRVQTQNTGLTLTTNRLDLQEVFLNLNYEAAKQWILLLKKFSDGELPPISIPTEFPKA